MPVQYPDELERWWLSEARCATGITDAAACLAELEPDVSRLSDLFTTERPESFPDYSADARARLAYGLFFFPQNFVRVSLVVAEWVHRRAPAPPPGRVLDLGCGLGASTLAVLHRSAGIHPGTTVAATAVDRSGENLLGLKRLFADCHALWPHAGLQTVEADLGAYAEVREPLDLIMLSFSLNEALAGLEDLQLVEWIQRRLKWLTPSGALIVVEPAGNTTSPRLERLRDALLEQGAARVLGPCLHGIPCPMRRENERWCHEVRRWQVPASVDRLNRRLFRTLHDLKFSFLILAPPGADATQPAAGKDPHVCRLVAPLIRQKGRIITAGCFASGQLHDLEMLTRHLPAGAPNPVKVLERGDIVRAVSPVPVGERPTLRAGALELLYSPTHEAP